MLTCSSCTRESPPEFSFCPYCGSPLDASAAAAQQRARSGDEGTAAERAPAEPRALTEERKVVTTLVCDLVGFTALSETHDHENVDAMLQSYASCARGIVESYGGVVEKFIGDAVVAVFGFPRAHDDDPERAVRAALKIAAKVPKLQWPGDSPLAVRIGINTGETYLHTDVDPASGETFLTGDAVNTAARLQSAAPPGGVVVGELTHNLIAKAFVSEPLEPLALKGKAEPVPAWQVSGPVSRTGLRTSGETATPLFGRQRELTALQDAFQTATETRQAQFVLLVGEPGIGKSRLVLEFAKSLDQRPELVTWRQGRCIPFGEGAGFWAFGEIVKAHAGILDSDDADAVESKLEAVLPEGEQRAWLRQCLRPLLGLAASQASQEESFAAWTQFLSHIASHGPTVLVLEDLHWAGEGLLAFIEHFAARELDAPLLLLATTRPELLKRHPQTLAGNDHVARLALSPLSKRDAGGLLSVLFEERLATAVRDPVLTRVAGNPLYAEEYVRLLLGRGLLVKWKGVLELRKGEELPLPDTVQAVLAARLDTLPADHKAVLCDAAVFGESFWTGAVAALAGRSADEVGEIVAGLSERQLVRPVAASRLEGETEYLFWHTLARDVAYAALPKRSRIRKHAAAADWLETAAGEGAEEFAAVLAHHYVTAHDLAQELHDLDQAAALAPRAGHHLVRVLTLTRRMVRRTGSLQENRRQLERALQLLPLDAPDRPRAFLLLGEVIANTQLADAVPFLREALPGLRASGRRNEASYCASTLAECLQLSNMPGGPRFAQEAIELLDEGDPSPELVYALWELASYCTQFGAPSRALEMADRGLRIADRIGMPHPPMLLGWRGAARCRQGDEGGLDDYRRALDLGRARGNVDLELWYVYGFYADSIVHWEGPRAALGLQRETTAFAQEHAIDQEYSSLLNEAQCLADLGDWDSSLAMFEELRAQVPDDDAFYLAFLETRQARLLVARGDAATVAESIGWLAAFARAGHEQPTVIVACYAAAALVCGALGRHREAFALLTETLAVDNAWLEEPDAGVVRTAQVCGDIILAQRLRDRFAPLTPLHRHVLASCDALLAEAQGNREAAAAGFADAAARWRDFGVVYEEALALLGQGRCLVALGRAPEAAPPLRGAREIFARLKAKPALDEADALLVRAADPPGQQGRVGSDA